MRSAFESKYAEWRSQKSRHLILSDAEYELRVDALKKFANGGQLSKQERNWTTRYSLAEDGSLIRSKKKVLVYTNLFDILHDCHVRRGHAGRDVMYSEFAHYHGLSKEIVQIYLNECKQCELVRSKVKKEVAEIDFIDINQILSNELNEQSENVAEESRSPTSNSPITTDPNVLSCRLCSESFQDVVHLQMHTIANHTQIQNLLGESRTTSSSPSNIVSRRSTDGQTRPACTLCQVDFEDTEAYGHHMAQHFSSTNAIYSCDKCALTFQFAEQFRRHFAMHHTDVLYRCAVCLKVFTKRHIYEEHTGEHLTTINTLNCVMCLRNFDKYNTFVEHLSSAHLDFGGASGGQRTEGTFGAQTLFGATDEGANMSAAARYLAERAWGMASESRGSAVAVSATAEAVSAAPVDNRLFRAPATSPQAPQLSMKGLKCSVCDEQFADELSLDEHRLVNHCMVHHGDSCAICRQTLANVEEFVAHSLAHAEKAFGALSCVVCRQTIHGEPQIRMHAQYHLRVELPRRSAATPTAVANRSPTVAETSSINDSNESDHVCEKCGEKFDQPDDLRTHSAEKHRRSSGAAQSGSSRPAAKQSYSPKFYHCVKCSLRFNSMARLAAHQRLHHLKRAQFKCKICDDKFTSDDLLGAHVKIHEMSITQFATGGVASHKAS